MGILAAVPVYGAGLTMYDGFPSLEDIDYLGIALLSIIGGGMAGYLIRASTRDRQ